MSPFLHRRLTDEQLGGRLALGEASAFDELYRRYVHRLSAYGAHLLGDGAAGDDVAQAALLKAYGALRAGRVPDQVRPWLYRIAHNAAIDLVRRRREIPAATLPEGTAPSGSESGALVAALSSLPDRQRRVYVLRELHGLRIDETATELGLTAQQVEQALFAARNRLAEHLVFGDRLNCASVRRLAAGPLELDERRALKSHLRSCPECRTELGLRGRALGTLPLGPSEWFQWIGGLLAGGGAPAAAKIGVVAAAATVAAGVPLAADRPAHFFHSVPAAQAAVAHRLVVKPQAHTQPARIPTAAVRQPVAAPPAPLEIKPASLQRDHTAETERSHPVEGTSPERRDRGERRDGGGGSGEDGGQPATTTTTIPVVSIGPAATVTTTTTTPAPTPQATTTTTESVSSGDGSSSSGSGDSSGGTDSSGSGDSSGGTDSSGSGD